MVYYEQAVALDSNFIAAWAARARAYSVLYANGVPEPAIARTALESAERARALGPERPEGYLALAEYHRNVTSDGARALEQAQLGLKIAPTDVEPPRRRRPGPAAARPLGRGQRAAGEGAGRGPPLRAHRLAAHAEPAVPPAL